VKGEDTKEMNFRHEIKPAITLKHHNQSAEKNLEVRDHSGDVDEDGRII
jgi:hypothetical protein